MGFASHDVLLLNQIMGRMEHFANGMTGGDVPLRHINVCTNQDLQFQSSIRTDKKILSVPIQPRSLGSSSAFLFNGRMNNTDLKA